MFSTLSQPDHSLSAAPPLPASITTVCSSLQRTGRFTVPSELHLLAAFGEIKLDLTEALFPTKHVFFVAESLCASLKVLLPAGATVVDHSTPICSSHELTQESQELGPVIHLDGWSLCSSVHVTVPTPTD